MTDLLSKVMAEVEQLPPDEQEKIAALVQRELDDLKWEATFATPESDRFLDELVEEARRDRAAGRTKESTDCW